MKLWEPDLVVNAIIEEWTAASIHPIGTSWHQCFRSVQAIATEIPAADDIYQPHRAEGNTWVKGPNMQFLRMAQGFQEQRWGAYDAWFLFEMDAH